MAESGSAMSACRDAGNVSLQSFDVYDEIQRRLDGASLTVEVLSVSSTSLTKRSLTAGY